MLEACSKCYECLCNEEYAISGKCDVAKKTLIDGLVVKFKEAMMDYFAEVGTYWSSDISPQYQDVLTPLLMADGLEIPKQGFSQQFWEKPPGQNWEKMIDLTANWEKLKT